MMNQTQNVRSAINIFILLAVGISLFQELSHLNQKPDLPHVPTAPNGQPMAQQPTGPKLNGIRIQSSDNFQTPLKQLLADKKLNIEIVSYEFQGNDYWMNMIASWGHVAIIFYFMTRHKNETDGGKKRTIMIMGAVAVVGWFYFSPKLKPQRFAIEVKGMKVYERDYFMDQEVANVLEEHEFEIDEMNENSKPQASNDAKGEAWEARSQQQQNPNEKIEDVLIEQEPIEF